MNALHRGDHTEPGKARDVVRVQVLGVLDAPAQVRLVRVGLVGALINVQHLAVGAVADGVHAQLVVVLQGQPRRLFECIHRARVQSGARGQVGVGLEQPGAVRPQRPVHRNLDRPDGQPVIAVADQAIPGQQLGKPRVGLANHDVEPHAQRPVVHQ